MELIKTTKHKFYSKTDKEIIDWINEYYHNPQKQPDCFKGITNITIYSKADFSGVTKVLVTFETHPPYWSGIKQ